MQSGRGLVKNVENARVVCLREMRGKLEALCFAAGKSGGGLAETQIAETDFVEDAQLRNDFRNVDEKGKRFAHGQLQHFMNVFSAVTHFQHAALEACATALFANQLDVREKLHFHGDRAVALARFAAPAGDIERKMACGVATALGVGRVRKDFANGVEGFEVRGGIGTRCAPDGRLVNNYHFADIRIALDAVTEFLDAPAHALRRERFVQNVMHERGFS